MPVSIRASVPPLLNDDALEAGGVADDQTLGAIGRKDRVEFLGRRSGAARGPAPARAAWASGSRVTSPRYHKGPSGSSRIDCGPASRAGHGRGDAAVDVVERLARHIRR